MPIRTIPDQGANPLSYVLSTDLYRRHLDESQRAMVASRLAKLSRSRPAVARRVDAGEVAVSIVAKVAEAAAKKQRELAPHMS
jgi:hypothetical protein